MTRILVVDDEPGIRRFVTRALESAGYTVESASDGTEALQAIASRHFDLVTLDLLLPGLGGMAVLNAIVEHDPSVRVLVLSAVGDIRERVRSLEFGAVDFLTKPFAVAELLARIKCRLNENSHFGPPAPLEIGGVRLDPARHTAHLEGRDVELSAREYLVLAHLMGHAGNVCTRQELLSEVWGFTFDPGSNVVDVCVARLRAKLADPHIETVRNVGYCFQTS